MKTIRIFILLAVNYAICNTTDENVVVDAIPKRSRLQDINDFSSSEVYKDIIENIKRIKAGRDFDNEFKPGTTIDKILIDNYYYSTKSKIKIIENDLALLDSYKSKIMDKIDDNKGQIEEYSYEIVSNKESLDKNKPLMSDEELDYIMNDIKAIKDENDFLKLMISEFEEMEVNLNTKLEIYNKYFDEIMLSSSAVSKDENTEFVLIFALIQVFFSSLAITWPIKSILFYIKLCRQDNQK
ncbi:hypothetical protein MACK_003582 [Theileria orientalis]|uniref:Fam-b protein n=1 Tax=Theileria orientalis TaxID=68886 RepID=A0A976SJC7_THEOR|nr:hypothetical protein MACK_003582 [Theileria orientalis]